MCFPAAGFVCLPVGAAPFTLSQTFDDPTPGASDGFGIAVSVSGNNVLIGVRNDGVNGNGNGIGQAHLYHATTGALLQSFNDPTPNLNDQFGRSVSVSDNNVLIGAALDDTDGVQQGQAHLFQANTGALLQTFSDPTPTSGDQFGRSVSASGNNLLIGAPGHAGLVGQAHLFNATTGTLLQTFNNPNPAAGDLFGFSVSVSGNNVLIGAQGDDTNGNNVGQAHLFDATTGALLQTFNDPTPTTEDQFGRSVAVEGNNVLIAAFRDDTNGIDTGQAHLFDATTGALLQTFNDPIPAANDRFGNSVSISGNNVLIGTVADDTNGNVSGQAHLFDAITGAWLQTINDPTLTNQDQFGTSVSISGNNVVIGALGDDTNGVNVGQAFLFSAAVVSEPGTLVLLGVGFVGLMLRRRKRKTL